MSAKENRNYLKPFRCVGGFMLVITLFVFILNVSLTGISLFTSSIFGDGIISNLVSELCLYGSICYTYYIGYRIFFKKYKIKLFEFKKIDSKKILNCFLSIIIGFILTRFIWILWELFLSKVGYVPIEDGNELYFIGIIFTTILAPIIEEIVFRGWILKALQKYGNIVAITLSSLAFGIYHGTATQSVPAIFIGVIFAILTIKYKSIVPSIIVHLLSNTLSIVLEVIEDFKFVSLLIKVFSVIFIVLSIVIIIYYLIIYIKKILNKSSDFWKAFKLQFYSISYISFNLFYIFNIIIDFINGIKN